MATLLLSGTQLEPQAPSVPKNKPFLIAVSFVYLIAMHVFMPNLGGDGLSLPFNAATWIAISIPLAIGLYQMSSYQRLRYSKLTIGLWICCVIMTLPLFFSNAQWYNELTRIIGLWAGFSLFLVLQQFHFSNKNKQKLLLFVVFASLIEALFGVYQYSVLHADNIFKYDTVKNLPYGIFQHPDAMASFLTTGLVLSGYLLARQPKKYNKKLSEVSLLYITPVVSIPLIIVLHSLVGWISAAVGVLLILPYLYRFSPRQRFINWVLATVSGLIIGLGALYLPHNQDRDVEPYLSSVPYSSVLPQSIDMLIEKPFTGYGYGKFESSYILYTARQHQLNPNYKVGIPLMEHPHNEFLFWGIEGGLLPVLGMSLAASFVLIRIYSAKKGTRLAMFALLLPIVIHSLVDAPFYQSSIHWLTFMILLFWIDQRVAKYRVFRFSKLSKTLLRITSLTLPIVTCFYMVSVLHTNFYLTKFETSNPKQLDILNKVVNPVLIKDRLDWEMYSTYLDLGLNEKKYEYIQPYIDWSLKIIQSKPRPGLYEKLIMAYQAIGDTSRAEQTKTEAEFLFPELDFSHIQYQSLFDNSEQSETDIE
ncbi:PglL family O-oligosaccharyltransferase [Vibrio diazotrophicus]|uniref:PglL family O-oligosaccharyltransferase n=1 Tax=Vibrio diazotrophicus TaxID=685 RepID=UPI0022AFBF8F|nr:PglL family O-oligosaccharyltransferase [Vibrio diazotrophicus]MCZ4373870.1 PglL family O-oligosaccharyltransferase [Vibrio diazotrophicus]